MKKYKLTLCILLAFILIACGDSDDGHSKRKHRDRETAESDMSTDKFGNTIADVMDEAKNKASDNETESTVELPEEEVLNGSFPVYIEPQDGDEYYDFEKCQTDCELENKILKEYLSDCDEDGTYEKIVIYTDDKYVNLGICDYDEDGNEYINSVQIIETPYVGDQVRFLVYGVNECRELVTELNAQAGLYADGVHMLINKYSYDGETISQTGNFEYCGSDGISLDFKDVMKEFGIDNIGWWDVFYGSLSVMDYYGDEAEGIFELDVQLDYSTSAEIVSYERCIAGELTIGMTPESYRGELIAEFKENVADEQILYFMCEDYDVDGVEEAYCVTGVFDEDSFNCLNANIYYCEPGKEPECVLENITGNAYSWTQDLDGLICKVWIEDRDGILYYYALSGYNDYALVPEPSGEYTYLGQDWSDPEGGIIVIDDEGNVYAVDYNEDTHRFDIVD